MVEPEMSRGGRHRNVRICREARGSRVRLSAAYDWCRIHSATPQQNATDLPRWVCVLVRSPILKRIPGQRQAELGTGPSRVPVAGSAIETVDTRRNTTGCLPISGRACDAGKAFTSGSHCLADR